MFLFDSIKKHVLEFDGHLPHVHLRRYITCLMYKIHIKMVVQVHFKGCFMLEKKLLIALGFEPTTLRLIDSFRSRRINEEKLYYLQIYFNV